MRGWPPKDPFSWVKVLAVEIAGTIIFVYFIAKELIHTLAH